jgi:hypothetical protein
VDSKLIRETLLRLRAEKRRIEAAIASIEQQMPGHISDEDLERHHLGMVKDEAELAPLEEHLLWCTKCFDRAESAADYADSMKAAAQEQEDKREDEGDGKEPPCMECGAP